MPGIKDRYDEALALIVNQESDEYEIIHLKDFILQNVRMHVDGKINMNQILHIHTDYAQLVQDMLKMQRAKDDE